MLLDEGEYFEGFIIGPGLVGVHTLTFAFINPHHRITVVLSVTMKSAAFLVYSSKTRCHGVLYGV